MSSNDFARAAIEARTEGYRGPATDDDSARWLSNTALLQHDHPRIRLLALRLTQLKAGPHAKTMACFKYVRSLPFRCGANPAGTPSVAVLAANAGDHFTKATLLIALLRSISIPARLRVVSCSPSSPSSVDDNAPASLHAFTEALIDLEWRRMDSCADQQSGSAAFGHFPGAQLGGGPLRDLGAFDDVLHFYQSIGYVRPGWAHKMYRAVLAATADRCMGKLRGAVPPDPQAVRIT
jgi:hypothetical protein